MPHPWTTPAATLALTSLGGAVLLAACSTPPPSAAPAVPAALPPVVLIPVASAIPSATPAPPPPTGPGTIACGRTRCQAGAELCCLGEPARCVPAPAMPADTSGELEASLRQKACGTREFLACDDAGDCATGQTCCEESYPSETYTLYQGACRPLRAGRVTCQRAELCSMEDSRCVRKGNACADEPGTRRCEIPVENRTRPRCGKKPCAAGMTCVYKDGEPTCMPGSFRNNFMERAYVIECNVGRDCGEDESCYQNPQLPGRRCDFTVGFDPLSEPAYCTGPEDCTAYCREGPVAVPNCHIAKKSQSGQCECLDPCTKDSDCRGCDRLVVLREDLPSGAVPFCDRRKGACECKAGKH